MRGDAQPLRPTDRSITPDLIHVAIAKGCELALTPTEYANGIARGKRIRRREQSQKRQKATP